jgi:hypothetical protein
MSERPVSDATPESQVTVDHVPDDAAVTVDPSNGTEQLPVKAGRRPKVAKASGKKAKTSGTQPDAKSTTAVDKPPPHIEAKRNSGEPLPKPDDDDFDVSEETWGGDLAPTGRYDATIVGVRHNHRDDADSLTIEYGYEDAEGVVHFVDDFLTLRSDSDLRWLKRRVFESKVRLHAILTACGKPSKLPGGLKNAREVLEGGEVNILVGRRTIHGVPTPVIKNVFKRERLEN